MKTVYGDTMSVLLTNDKSVSCSIKIGKRIKNDGSNYANLSVRFDQGPIATICGYPHAWLLHDQNVDYYDYDSPFGREVYLDFEDGAYEGRFSHYISPECEIEFLKGVLKGIQRQAKDPMFQDRCSREYRNKCISMIEAKIEELGKESAK